MKQGTIAKLALTVAVVAGGAGFLVYSSTKHAQRQTTLSITAGSFQLLLL